MLRAACQLAAQGDARDPAAETAELAVCMVIPVLYSAARLTSCPPGALPSLATQGSLREALVRVPASPCPRSVCASGGLHG